MTTTKNQASLSVRGKLVRGDGATTHVKFRPHLQGPASDALNLLRAEPRNDLAPLPNRCGTNTQRPRDIRGALKVINNVLLEHDPHLTIVKSRLQPQWKTGVLTLVDMDHLPTLADRLKDAMGDDISASELARACSVSPAAVSKWLGNGKMSADNLAAAARALGVNQDWLRTGKLPRERHAAQEERHLDEAISILTGLREPLSALVGAIDALSKAQDKPAKRSRGAR